MSSILDALGYIGQSLDKPGRAVRGVLGGRPEEALAAIPFSDAMGLTSQANSVSGRQLLDQLGVTNQDSGLLGDALGMGAEVALDPTNLIGGALFKRLLGMRAAAREANAGREALIANGAMPAEVAALTKAVDADGRPLKVFHGGASDFGQFDMSKMDPGALYGPGAYFTDNPDVASSYARMRGGAKEAGRSMAQSQLGTFQDDVAAAEARLAGATNPADKAMLELRLQPKREAVSRLQAELADTAGPNVRAHFLDVRNPLDMRASYEQGSEIPEALSTLLGSTKPTSGQGIYDAVSGDLGKADATEFLRNVGYDSFTHEGGNIVGRGKKHNVFITADPSRIYAPLVAPREQPVRSLSPLLAALGIQNAGARGGSQL